jgi:hypothetical protein
MWMLTIALATAIVLFAIAKTKGCVNAKVMEAKRPVLDQPDVSRAVKLELRKVVTRTDPFLVLSLRFDVVRFGQLRNLPAAEMKLLKIERDSGS